MAGLLVRRLLFPRKENQSHCVVLLQLKAPPLGRAKTRSRFNKEVDYQHLRVKAGSAFVANMCCRYWSVWMYFSIPRPSTLRSGWKLSVQKSIFKQCRGASQKLASWTWTLTETKKYRETNQAFTGFPSQDHEYIFWPDMRKGYVSDKSSYESSAEEEETLHQDSHGQKWSSLWSRLDKRHVRR